MNALIKEIEKLKKDEGIREKIKERMKEFEKIGKSNSKDIFSELCFCILTANFNAERGIKIQNKLKNDFLRANRKILSEKLRKLGYRYPNTRAKYIVEARKKLKEIVKVVKSKNLSDFKKREWLVKNVKGIGYKEASHFLRNTGHKDLAIIDFHILNLLAKSRIINKKPKNLSKKVYLEIEQKLRKLAKRLKVSLGELDLYMWYLETSKILK